MKNLLSLRHALAHRGSANAAWPFWILVAAGTLFRLMHYAGERSLWLDELFLVLTLEERSFGELAAVLDRSQMAPLGFLWGEKFFSMLLGGSELGFRALPLLASLAGLFVFPPVARHLLGRTGAIVAVALFALSPTLVYYAAETKQYALDATASVLMLAAATALRQRPGWRAHAWLLLACIVLPWWSHAVAFVIFAVGVTLFTAGWRQQNRSAWLGALLVSAAGLASFVAHLTATSFWVSPTVATMQWFWAPLFVPWQNPGAAVTWLGHAGLGLLKWPLGISSGVWAALFGGMGVVALARARRPLLAWIGLPIAAALGASAAELYPFGERFLLFAAPLVALLLAAGFEELRRHLQPDTRLVPFAIAALLLGPPAAQTVSQARQHPPFAREESRPLWDRIRNHFADGDALYVSRGAGLSMAFYAPDLRDRAAALITGMPEGSDWKKYLAHARAVRAHDRVWLVFSHIRPDLMGVAEDALLLASLDGAQIELTFREPGARAYLVTFSRIAP